MEVTGRDRVHFFRRPILPNTTPLPYIRYAREISLDVADIKKRDRLKEEAGIKRVTINEPTSPTKVQQYHRRLPRNRKNQRKLDHLDLAYGLEGSPASKITPMPSNGRRMLHRGLSIQTDCRDSEAQTDPTTLDYAYEYKDVLPEVSALEMLRYGPGGGLPVQDEYDLQNIDRLRYQKMQCDNLPSVQDSNRVLAQNRVLENQQQIEMALKSKSSNNRRLAHNQQMRNAVQEFAETSAVLLQERLDRLWRHKQKEKDLKMSRIRRIHDKEIKALERKCQIKNERLRSDLMGGRFKMLENAQQLRQSTSASGPLITETESYGVANRRPIWFDEPQPSGTQSSRGRLGAGRIDEDFLEEYNHLRWLEKDTTRTMTAIADKTLSSSDKKFADINDKPLGQKFRGKNGYVPRADRYNNLLDTAYADIVEKRRSAPQNLETIKKVEKKQDNLNQPQNISAPVTSKTPTVSDDEDEDAFIQRHNLEILKASVEAKDKQAHQKAFYDENTTDNDDVSTTNYEINGNNGNGRRNSRRRKKLLTAEEEAHLAAEREAQIEAFLDQIEGETLGEMMNYLSSELESTTFGHFEAAAAALESTTSGGDENASENNEAKKTSSTCEVVTSLPTQREKDEEEKIYSEITKLTRSTVDRYLDKIILDILYKTAASVAEKETDQQLGNQRDFQQLQRRSSASEVEISSTTLSGGCNRHYIKMRLKELQKSRLMAVHDALVVVLEEMKASGEIRKEDKNEVEQNIRDALESVCNPDDVEKELRSALATLNLESREEYS